MKLMVPPSTGEDIRNKKHIALQSGISERGEDDHSL